MLTYYIRILYIHAMPLGSRSARDSRTVVPVALSAETEGRLQEAAKKLGLSREQTLLVCLRRGLTVLERPLTGRSVPPPHA